MNTFCDIATWYIFGYLTTTQNILEIDNAYLWNKNVKADEYDFVVGFRNPHQSCVSPISTQALTDMSTNTTTHTQKHPYTYWSVMK